MEKFSKNLETSHINSNIKVNAELLENLSKIDNLKEKLNKFDVSLLDNVKNIGLFKNQLNGEIFINKLKDWIVFLKEFLNSIKFEQGFDWFILKKISKIDEEVFCAINQMYKEVFSFFLPKAVWKDIRKIKSSSLLFLDVDFYNKKRTSNMEIVDSLYVIAASYYISYIQWLYKLKQSYNAFVNKNSHKYIKNQNLILSFLNKLNKKDENYWPLLAQITLFSSIFEEKDLKLILQNLYQGRYKTLSSSILKLLKKPKYLSEFEKEGILADQYGFLVRFDNMKDLKIIASSLDEKHWNYLEEMKKFDEYSKSRDFAKLSSFFEENNNRVFVNKYNDRWVLKNTSTNTETSKKLIPFVNWWFSIFCKNNFFSLWEISCRFNYKVKLNEILDEYNNLKKAQKDKFKFITHLLEEIDEFDHEIYKTSQEIKILRKLFIDQEILPKKRNLRDSAMNFIDYKLSFLVKDVKEKLKKEKININFSDEEIQYPILKRLKEQIEQVIFDLAWERVKEKIKQTEKYKNMQSFEKREYLKQLSSKIILAYKAWKLKIRWSEENSFFQDFKREYKSVIKTAIFYSELSWKIAIIEATLSVK